MEVNEPPARKVPSTCCVSASTVPFGLGLKVASSDPSLLRRAIPPTGLPGPAAARRAGAQPPPPPARGRPGRVNRPGFALVAVGFYAPEFDDSVDRWCE